MIVLEVSGGPRLRLDVTKSEASAVCKSISNKVRGDGERGKEKPGSWEEAILRTIHRAFSSSKNYYRWKGRNPELAANAERGQAVWVVC